jgi:TetR/AcrR family transcriptional repressor of bet genes
MARDALKEARRIQLMEATIDCIAARGFADLTLADVAKAAGLSVGIVNFYFKSKDALLAATLAHMVGEYQRYWRANVEAAGPSPAAKLTAMLEGDFQRLVANRKTVTVWYAFWGETRWRPDFMAVCQDLSADLIARGFDAMIDGLWLDMLISPKAVDREAAKQVVRTYLAGIFPNEFGRQSTGGAAKAATA